MQSARREGNSGRVASPLLGRLTEVETQLTEAALKANRENGTVYLQVGCPVTDIDHVGTLTIVLPQIT